MPTGQLLLARHGQTSWNALGRLQGHTDIELDDVGRAQAAALATTVAGAGIAMVWTSDLARAQQTGAIVAGALGLATPTREPALRERRFGVFEGLTREECAAQYPAAWQAWIESTTAPPGGEPREEAVTRLGQALAQIAERSIGPALVVSHGGVMRLWLMDLLGHTIPLLPNGVIYELELEGARFKARRR